MKAYENLYAQHLMGVYSIPLRGVGGNFFFALSDSRKDKVFLIGSGLAVNDRALFDDDLITLSIDTIDRTGCGFLT